MLRRLRPYRANIVKDTVGEVMKILQQALPSDMLARITPPIIDSSNNLLNKQSYQCQIYQLAYAYQNLACLHFFSPIIPLPPNRRKLIEDLAPPSHPNRAPSSVSSSNQIAAVTVDQASLSPPNRRVPASSLPLLSPPLPSATAPVVAILPYRRRRRHLPPPYIYSLSMNVSSSLTLRKDWRNGKTIGRGTFTIDSYIHTILSDRCLKFW